MESLKALCAAAETVAMIASVHFNWIVDVVVLANLKCIVQREIGA